MPKRTILVPVDYYDYSPSPVIIGIRPARLTHTHGEEAVLRSVAEACPGWSTLAFAEQTPVGWSRRNALRVRVSIASA